MSSRNNSVDNQKHFCGQKHPASCVAYEGFIPKSSDLISEECVVVSETIEDLYRRTEELKNAQEVVLEERCDDAPQKLTTQELSKRNYEQLCNLKGQLEKGNHLVKIEHLGLDLACLTTECGDPITTLKDLLQQLIYQSCYGTPTNPNDPDGETEDDKDKIIV